VPQCPNCSADLTGPYCAACGQRAIDPRDLSSRRFVSELTDEVGSLGSRTNTVLRTLRGLFTPGLLTVEFLAGRRQPYLSPIKVYFACAAIFFLAAPLAGFTLPSLIADDTSGELLRLVAARAAARGLDAAVFSQRFDLRLPSIYTLALGSGVLAIALLLWLFRRRIPFGAHVVFALHYFAFLYLLTAAAGASRRLGVPDEAAAGAAIALLAPYAVIALRRAYPQSLPRILLKSALMIGLTLAVNFVADTAAIRLTLAML
jgi:Protein of unknown function (DUF3667)